jgi:photosystem II stability/assembly factor-like uncharacterized protein
VHMMKNTHASIRKTLLPASMLLYVSFSSAAMDINLPAWSIHMLENSASLRGSAIIDQSLWVTGTKSTVFVSQDGGKTWKDKSPILPTERDFRDIELFDRNTAIIMSVGNGADSVLYKTENGGDTWNTLYENKDEAGFFDSIAFWDNDNGLLLGDPVDGFYVVKKTTDGGKTWRRIEQTYLPEKLDREAAFAASGNTLIVGENGKAWLTTGGHSASVYSSSDYGETWQRHVVSLYNETETAGGYGLGLNHKEQVFVVGGDYQQRDKTYLNMATFMNGDWAAVDSGKRGLRTAMQCQGNICIASGKTGNDISFNAGKSWQSLDASNKQDITGFYTLAASDMVFLAAGADGKIGVVSLKPK